jgi:hypothetical protein
VKVKGREPCRRENGQVRWMKRTRPKGARRQSAAFWWWKLGSWACWLAGLVVRATVGTSLTRGGARFACTAAIDASMSDRDSFKPTKPSQGRECTRKQPS